MTKVTKNVCVLDQPTIKAVIFTNMFWTCYQKRPRWRSAGLSLHILIREEAAEAGRSSSCSFYTLRRECVILKSSCAKTLASTALNISSDRIILLILFAWHYIYLKPLVVSLLSGLMQKTLMSQSTLTAVLQITASELLIRVLEIRLFYFNLS